MLPLLLTLSASADELYRSSTTTTLDDGGVLIRLGGQVVPADQAGKATTTLPNLHRTISLDLQKADIHNVLRLFADVSGLNFVAGDDVQGTVTVLMKDVPWDQALAVILQSKGLGAQLYGQRIITVEPLCVP